METAWPFLLTVVTSFVASGGFWAYIQKRDTQKSATVQLLLGLAHDRIIFLGTKYLDRGWLTYDEYEDFIKYLYEPYSHFGGNGLAEKVMQDVARLPMRGKDVTETHVTTSKEN